MGDDQEDMPGIEGDPDRPVRSSSDVDMLRRVRRLLEEVL